MTGKSPAESTPEIRKDLLVNRWVIFAPSRANRPEVLSQDGNVEYNPEMNPFCEGHESHTPHEIYAINRHDRQPDSTGWLVRVFPNAYPALVNTPLVSDFVEGIFSHTKSNGRHELIVDCPEFQNDFCQLPAGQMKNVLLAYRDRMQSAYQQPGVQYVQVFKNQGAAAGASLPHPHSQLMTFPMIPPIVQEEINGCHRFYKEHENYFFTWLIKNELANKNRVICETTYFVAITPYASRFAYEVAIIPKQGSSCYTQIKPVELADLAELLSRVLKALAGNIPLPSFNLVIHSVPELTPNSEYYRWHLEILPRISGIAGFEMGTGCYVNTLYPEQAAQLYQSI